MKKILRISLELLLFTGVLYSCSSQSGKAGLPNIKYEIVRTDNRVPIINLDVYLPDTSQLDSLHQLLIQQYNPSKDKSMTIMYFDDKEIAKVWHQKVVDDVSGKVSEAEWKKLQIHRIALYNSNPSTKFEQFQRDKWE